MITSTGNQQIKNIMQLQKKAKARWQQRVFVVEGTKLALEAPREWVEQVYVSETFLLGKVEAAIGEGLLDYYGNGEWLGRLSDRCGETEWKERLAGCQVVSDAVMKAMSDTQAPQGILCLVRMPEYSLEDLLKKENPHLLVLEDIQDPGNLGTMLRTGEGAGVDGVIINGATVDLFNPKTIRSTMGSLYRVPFFLAEHLAGTLLELKHRGITLYAAHLKGTKSYDEPDYTKGTAFLIGNEGNGLSEGTAGLADAYIRIPMEGRVESLNAAIAATLLMYEVNRQRR